MSQAGPPDALPALPDGEFRRVLCVVAHPDDVEYGTSAAVAQWTSRGIEVAYLLLTRGEAGIDSMTPDATAELRSGEQHAACAAVGVTDLTMLDYPDGVLEYSIAMRRDVAREIRRFQPDAVVLGSWEVEFVAGLNQADHRVAGLVALDAVRDAGNRWVFPELADEGLEPWSPRWVLSSGDPRATHGVALSEADVERGVAALEAHAGYLGALAWHPPARTLITAIAAMSGPAMGVRHAVLFRAWDLQAPPPIPLDD